MNLEPVRKFDIVACRGAAFAAPWARFIVPLRPNRELVPNGRCTRRWLQIAFSLILLALLTAACTRNSDSLTPTSPPPTATPPISGAAQLRSALTVDDQLARRAATLVAIEVYLTGPDIVSMDDESASQALTEVAFSTGSLVVPDRSFVRRAPGQPQLTVVGLPDAMGIALYDLRDEHQSEPLLLSEWTAGLQAVFVTWGQDEIGVNYLTLGNDGYTRAHFVLAQRVTSAESWRVVWFSDEERLWWLNALEGQLAAASDLSHLTLVGESSGTTLAFDEEASGLRRSFGTNWQREGSEYVLSPDPSNYDSVQEWLWAIAAPGPYATLVEFIERLQLEDTGGASKLATSSIHGLTAATLDLDSPSRRYVVLEQNENSIIFGDVIGTYQIIFRPPSQTGEKWLVLDITAL